MSGDCTLSATAPPMRVAAATAASAEVASASGGRGMPYSGEQSPWPRTRSRLGRRRRARGRFPSATLAMSRAAESGGGAPGSGRNRPVPGSRGRSSASRCSTGCRPRRRRPSPLARRWYRSHNRIGLSRGPLIAASAAACPAAVASLAKRADQQDRVDALGLAQDLDDPRIADLVDRLGGGVDRVARRGIGRQQCQDLPLDLVLQLRHFEPMRREDVGHPYRTAARPGDDRDAVAARQRAKRKGCGDIEHVVEVFAANDAVMAKDRVVDRPRNARASRCARPPRGARRRSGRPWRRSAACRRRPPCRRRRGNGRVGRIASR